MKVYFMLFLNIYGCVGFCNKTRLCKHSIFVRNKYHSLPSFGIQWVLVSIFGNLIIATRKPDIASLMVSSLPFLVPFYSERFPFQFVIMFVRVVKKLSQSSTLTVICN